MNREKTITHLQLQARKSSIDEWGILNTVQIPHLPYRHEGTCRDKAQEEIEHLRNRWLENWNPNLQFRVVEL